MGTEVEILTDHRTLQKWYHNPLLTVSGPLGRRGRWHEFLLRYPLVEVGYTPGARHIVPDVLSRWAYPANTAAPDSSLHGSENDAAAPERTEVEVREQENQALRERPLFADCMQELERGSKSLHLLSQNDRRQKWVITNRRERLLEDSARLLRRVRSEQVMPQVQDQDV